MEVSFCPAHCSSVTHKDCRPTLSLSMEITSFFWLLTFPWSLLSCDSRSPTTESSSSPRACNSLVVDGNVCNLGPVFHILRDEAQKRKLVNTQSSSRLPSSGYPLRASYWFPLLLTVPGTHHCLVHRLPDTHPFFVSCLPGGEGCARGGRTRRGDERGVWDLCRCPVVGPGESLSLKGNLGEVTWKLDC